MVGKMKAAKVRRKAEEDAVRKGLKSSEAREMVTPALRKALTKQGEIYT